MWVLDVLCYGILVNLRNAQPAGTRIFAAGKHLISELYGGRWSVDSDSRFWDAYRYRKTQVPVWTVERLTASEDPGVLVEGGDGHGDGEDSHYQVTNGQRDYKGVRYCSYSRIPTGILYIIWHVIYQYH